MNSEKQYRIFLSIRSSEFYVKNKFQLTLPLHPRLTPRGRRRTGRGNARRLASDSRVRRHDFTADSNGPGRNARSRMRILLVHNRYAYRGGEDAVFEQERDLLLTQGHLVVESKDNREIDADRKLGLALGTIWAQGAYNECSRLMADFRPDIVSTSTTRCR